LRQLSDLFTFILGARSAKGYITYEVRSEVPGRKKTVFEDPEFGCGDIQKCVV